MKSGFKINISLDIRPDKAILCLLQIKEVLENPELRNPYYTKEIFISGRSKFTEEGVGHIGYQVSFVELSGLFKAITSLSAKIQGLSELLQGNEYSLGYGYLEEFKGDDSTLYQGLLAIKTLFNNDVILHALNYLQLYFVIGKRCGVDDKGRLHITSKSTEDDVREILVKELLVPRVKEKLGIAIKIEDQMAGEETVLQLLIMMDKYLTKKKVDLLWVKQLSVGKKTDYTGYPTIRLSSLTTEKELIDFFGSANNYIGLAYALMDQTHRDTGIPVTNYAELFFEDEVSGGSRMLIGIDNINDLLSKHKGIRLALKVLNKTIVLSDHFGFSDRYLYVPYNTPAEALLTFLKNNFRNMES